MTSRPQSPTSKDISNEEAKNDENNPKAGTEDAIIQSGPHGEHILALPMNNQPLRRSPRPIEANDTNSRRLFEPEQHRRAPSVSNLVPRQPADLPEQLAASTATAASYSRLNVDPISDQRQGNQDVFGHLWGGLLLLCNIYTFVAFFFFLGIPNHPQGFFLVLELLTELLLLLDAVFHVWINITGGVSAHPHLSRLLTPAGWGRSKTVTMVTKCIASLPQYSLFLLCGLPKEELSSLWLAWVRVLKLLRLPEIPAFLGREMKLARGVFALAWQLLEYILYFFMSLHGLSMCWLFVVRVEDDPRWVRDFGYDRASLSELYVVSVFMTVCSTGTVNFADTYAITKEEKLMFFVLAVAGCAGMTVILGNMTNLIYLQNAEASQNKRNVELAELLTRTRGLPKPFADKLVSYYSGTQARFKTYSKADV